MSVSRLRCTLVGHRWLKVRQDGEDTPDGSFLRCRRCAIENHQESSGVSGAMLWGFRGPPS
ncbi:MAG: hypothetical protein QOE05_2951 [Actinomycetota bacterium]|nr:hypothetical protein [Actinomycetota bacterium]